MDLPLQENKRTDQVIEELIKSVVIPPALNRAWVLDRVGNSELDQTTVLADTTAYSRCRVTAIMAAGITRSSLH